MGKEKKEIGKLIELLNERIKEGWKPYGYDYSITKIDEIWKSDGLYFVSFVGEDYPGPVNLEHLLTKQAELIKWLVENDKIDIKKLIIKGEMRSGWDFENKKGDEETGEEIWNKYYSELCLMLLSISDTPIEDLISYLK